MPAADCRIPVSANEYNPRAGGQQGGLIGVGTMNDFISDPT